MLGLWAIICKIRSIFVKTKNLLLIIIVFALSICFIYGCAKKPKVTNTGFLEDYSLLNKHKDPLGYVHKLYLSENADVNKFDKIIPSSC